MTPKIIVPNSGMCKKCGFYMDCPMDYMCPAAEVLSFVKWQIMIQGIETETIEYDEDKDD